MLVPDQTSSLSDTQYTHPLMCCGVLLQYELDLLVSSTPDGQLVLSDCFCLDTVVSAAWS